MMGAHAVRLSNVDIDNALKNRDFEVLFQPIFDLGNGALARVETFVRWRHATLGILPPGAFISFFETQGRMGELTRYVLAEALDRYQEWRGPYAPGFSINLALSDLSDDAFATHFTVLLRERGFPTQLVTLECPMPPVTMDNGLASHRFAMLRQTGARLAIEVRGRANDFLRQVSPFPFDEIKTGGAAILRFARTVRGPGLSAISELLELAQEQNAAITAVGVEDQASLSALRSLGFAAAQGNHLGKVGPLSQFTPSRVNEVRELLGLSPLSKADLAALFRTGAPAAVAVAGDRLDVAEKRVAKPAQGKITSGAAAGPGADALVDRLNARIARAAPNTVNLEDASSEEAAIAAAARETEAAAQAEKARAAAQAARQAATEERKAAAIARARQKAGQSEGRSAPHDLQERLSREFESMASDFGEADADLSDKTADVAGDQAADLSPGSTPLTPGETPAEAVFASAPSDDDRAPPRSARIFRNAEREPVEAEFQPIEQVAPRPAAPDIVTAPSLVAPDDAPSENPQPSGEPDLFHPDDRAVLRQSFAGSSADRAGAPESPAPDIPRPAEPDAPAPVEEPFATSVMTDTASEFSPVRMSVDAPGARFLMGIRVTGAEATPLEEDLAFKAAQADVAAAELAKAAANAAAADTRRAAAFAALNAVPQSARPAVPQFRMDDAFDKALGDAFDEAGAGAGIGATDWVDDFAAGRRTSDRAIDAGLSPLSAYDQAERLEAQSDDASMDEDLAGDALGETFETGAGLAEALEDRSASQGDRQNRLYQNRAAGGVAASDLGADAKSADQARAEAYAAAEVGAADVDGPDGGAENEGVAEAPVAGARTQSRPKRRGNFLTRKYRLMPTHFWPRSWKRAWARRKAQAQERRQRQFEQRLLGL